MSGEDNQILKFRPRTLAKAPGAARNARAESAYGTATGDVAPNARDRTRPDDYRHRMMINLAALAFTAALTGIGIWLAVKLADLRSTQDCVLMGRRDCAHISSPKD